MTGEGAAQVLVMVPGYPPAYLGGGPIRTIEAMVELRDSIATVQVLTAAHDHGAIELLDVPVGQWVIRGRAQVFYANMRSNPGRWAAVIELRRSTAHTLYLNSLFDTWFSIVPLVLQRIGWTRFDRVVLAPRGELDPGALALKGSKKCAFLRAAKVIGLPRAVVFHASTAIEARHIERIFDGAAMLVKENEKLVQGRPESDPTVRRSSPQFVYLGRVSAKKRVHLLIEAVALLDGSLDLALVVHGGGDKDYLAHCAELAERLGVTVDFRGPLEHDRVPEAFDAADYACFPTAGENFGHVIAEALARGCPVLVGDVTPWTPYIEEGGGIVVTDSASPADWAEVLKQLATEAPDLRPRRRADALAAFRRWEGARPRGTFLDALLNSPREKP